MIATHRLFNVCPAPWTSHCILFQPCPIGFSFFVFGHELLDLTFSMLAFKSQAFRRIGFCSHISFQELFERYNLAWCYRTVPTVWVENDVVNGWAQCTYGTKPYQVLRHARQKEKLHDGQTRRRCHSSSVSTSTPTVVGRGTGAWQSSIGHRTIVGSMRRNNGRISEKPENIWVT